MDDAFDLDLDASRIAYRDGEPVGLGNLGLRGEDSWIGGVGVVTAARRSGVGEALMRALHDQAGERGIRRVWLEVIAENTGAFALYEKLGYRTVRDVQVWSLPVSVSERSDADDATAEDAHARIKQLHAGREPWQRADGTLAHYADARGLVTAAGAAVYRQPGENVQLVQIAGDQSRCSVRSGPSARSASSTCRRTTRPSRCFGRSAPQSSSVSTRCCSNWASTRLDGCGSRSSRRSPGRSRTT